MAASVQPPALQWQKTFGGTNDDYGERLALAPDGGYLIAAYSMSGISGEKETSNYGGYDGWLIRIDSQGNKLWERNFGGSSADMFVDVKATLDGGWVVLAQSGSPPFTGNKTSPLYGTLNYWVLRLDANGNKIWERSFGGGYLVDNARSVLATPDGGFLVGGSSQSNTNEIKTVPQFGTRLPGDVWLLKLDGAGNILWQRAYGGVDYEMFGDFDVCGTNGFVVVASSSSNGTGNKETANYGSSDFWVLFIDVDGNKVWERAYGGDGADEPFRVRRTTDNGFIICGWTGSGISGNKTTALVGAYDGWVLRLDSSGEKLWEQTVGTGYTDVARSICQMPDGGFLTIGSADWKDAWMVRFDAAGNKVWERMHRIGQQMGGADVMCTADGGVLVTGGAFVSGGRWEVALMKFGADTLTAPQLQIAPGTRELTLRGIPGRSYVTEAIDGAFAEWTPVATNLLESETVMVPDITPAQTRFYRARLLP